MHSAAMVKLQKVVKRYILQWFQDVINFLVHNAGLGTIFFLSGVIKNKSEGKQDEQRQE